MKKIILSIIAVLAISTLDAQTINFPFGAPQGYVLSASGTTAFTQNNLLAYPSSVTTLTAATVFSVTADAKLKVGAKLLFAATTSTTSVVSFSGAIVSPTITGVANKTFSQEFWYDGTYFRPTAIAVQTN